MATILKYVLIFCMTCDRQTEAIARTETDADDPERVVEWECTRCGQHFLNLD